MTAQISDSFQYQEEGYALVDTSDGNDAVLLDPTTLGLSPSPSTTACWRGYSAGFAVADGQLVLDKLHISLRKFVDGKSVSQKGTPINGIVPISDANKNGRGTMVNTLFNNHYEGLAVPVLYSGGVLLGRNWIPGRDGYYPFWRYEKVLELVFEQGVLQESFDRSQDLVDFQVQYKAYRAGKIDMPDRAQIREIMIRSFARTYKV